MPGITELAQLLSSLEPAVREGQFVYASFETVPDGLPVEATVREDEGTTVVLRREAADAAGIEYDYVAGWVTLTVQSSLEAVGMTAAFATALGEAGLSCNVLAGLHHDHLLVPYDRVAEAVEALHELSRRAARDR
jgi:hypothetical protein